MWLTNERRYAAECRTHGTVHHQAAQEGTELSQVFGMKFDDLIVAAVIMTVIETLARRDLVVHAVESHSNRDDDGGYRQRIEKSRQESRHE